MYQLTKLATNDGKINEYLQAIHSINKLSVFGLNMGEKLLLASQISNPLFYIVEDRNTAELCVKNFRSLGKKAILIEPQNSDYNFHLMEFGNNGVDRQGVLYKVLKADFDVVISTPQILANTFPATKLWEQSEITVAVGQDCNLENLCSKLVASGYQYGEMVTQGGMWARRGDVLDIFPINSELPIRLHFFDTLIEKMTTFNVISQFSIQEIQNFTLCPNGFALTQEQVKELDGELSKSYLQQKNKIALSANPSQYLQNLSCFLQAQDCIKSGVSRSLWQFCSPYLPNCNILDYLPKNCTVVIDQPKLCFELLMEFCNEVDVNIDNEIKYGNLATKHLNNKFDIKNISPLLKNFSCLSFQSILTQNKFFSPVQVISFETIPIPSLTSDWQNLASKLKEFTDKNYKVILNTIDSTSANFFYEKLNKYCDCELVGNLTDVIAGRLNILVNSLLLGAVFVQDKILLLGSNESKKKQLPNTKIAKNIGAIEEFCLPAQGDYVVHSVHGIGICEGVQQIVINGAKRDYVVISYNNNDKVYVPTEQLDLLGRYIGGSNPKLNTIGSATWEGTKAKVRASVKELAFDLLTLYKSREKTQGSIMKCEDSILAEFELSFDYTPTADQLSAFNDVYQDMASGKIMDRLIVGDVGYGKTEVAMRSAFVAVMSGYQVCLLVPTTILSVQHYNTFCARLQNFGIVVKVLNRFCSTQQVKSTLQELKDGKVDIIIGTHRVLSKDVVFNNLGLLILDEEQRFGVGDKEKIKNIKKDIHVLTLTATPIPRTLHISLVGIRDISTIETPPLDRLPVQTIVAQYNDNTIQKAIQKELARNGQTLVVVPRIENMENYAIQLHNLVPEARVAIAHGQMDKGQLEEVMLSLYRREIDVLLATTLIENGIDLPNANSLFVLEAQRFGLSQLYQLRGRVGRSSNLSYAYFTYNDEGVLTVEAYQRLSALMQYTALGSGFKIAMRDLEIRGAGNILGPEQHGQMEKVGYDLYCKILESSVQSLRGEKVEEDFSVKIDIDQDAFIPENFVTDKVQRMEIYSAIANIKNQLDYNQVIDMLNDKYTTPTPSIITLCDVALLKANCKDCHISRVIITKERVAFYMEKSFVEMTELKEIAKNQWQVYEKANMLIISLLKINNKSTQNWQKLNSFIAQIQGKNCLK